MDLVGFLLEIFHIKEKMLDITVAVTNAYFSS